MQNLIQKDYEGLSIQFTNNGWFNATMVAKRFRKRPSDWLRLPETEEYLAALCRKSDVRKSHFIFARKGNSKKFQQGTWLHPKLGVPFARWLDVDFAVWCDEQIDELIRGELDVKRARHQSAASFKVMMGTLQLQCDAIGKKTQPYHYINEARLINWCITGAYTALDRDSLSNDELDLLARLEERNACLIAMGMSYPLRKQALIEYIRSTHPELEVISPKEVQK